jgi:hypothetical protein
MHLFYSNYIYNNTNKIHIYNNIYIIMNTILHVSVLMAPSSRKYLSLYENDQQDATV